MKKFVSIIIVCFITMSMFTSCNLISSMMPKENVEINSSAESTNTDDNSKESEVSIDSQTDSEVDTETETDDGVVDGGFTQEYEYNDKGQMTKVFIYNTDSDLKATVENEYNKEGKIKTIKLTDAEGKLRCRNVYEYKKDPNDELYLSKDTYYDGDGKVVLYVLYDFSKESNSLVTVGYFDGKDKELDANKANELIQDLNKFMHE